MAEVKKLPTREEVPVEKTWDLTTIYETDDACEADIPKVVEYAKEMKLLQGTLANGSEALLHAIETLLGGMRIAERIYTYSHLKNDQDTANSTYQALQDRALAAYTQLSEATSWFNPELLSLSAEQLASYLEENEKLSLYRHMLDDITSQRAHVLSAREEELLAGASEIFGSAGRTFSVLNNADMEFPVVHDEEGNEVKLSHGMYSKLMESPNREVRKEAFEALYKTYSGLKNTFATTLGTNVKTHNYSAKVRNFPSARAAALANNHIPESVYDTLVDVVNKNLPLLHRYVALRKKMLGVDTLHMYDMYTPLTGKAPLAYSIEEATDVTMEALKPLGDEYQDILKQAFSKRWIDWEENEGKRSGAYSSGAYDTNPYILMNWHDSLNELYTLVHELGHSAHSYFTRNNQPYVYGDYSIFLAEIASTTNENILTDYLLKTETDPAVRFYVLNHYLDGFKGTIFRQTQFAEFENYIHKQAQEGESLTHDFLTNYYGDLNAKYYGPAVEKDPEIALEWTRIPHFYYNHYVYQYATGLSAATALSKRILDEEEGALDKYLTYLKSGSSDYPIDVMKKAGVDMTQATYIEDAMAVFESRLEELEKLVEEMY